MPRRLHSFLTMSFHLLRCGSGCFGAEAVARHIGQPAGGGGGTVTDIPGRDQAAALHCGGFAKIALHGSRACGRPTASLTSQIPTLPSLKNLADLHLLA
jgi:hypothetical protein